MSSNSFRYKDNPNDEIIEKIISTEIPYTDLVKNKSIDNLTKAIIKLAITKKFLIEVLNRVEVKK